jgi:hypothetical protein
LTYDNQAPDIIGEGGFFVEMLQTAVDYNLVTAMRLTPSLYSLQFGTFEQYLSIPYSGTQALVAWAYPQANSAPGDPVSPAPIPVQAALYLPPVTSPASFVCQNWAWMLTNEQGFEASYGESVGYPLRAWAESEASAITDKCPVQ